MTKKKALLFAVFAAALFGAAVLATLFFKNNPRFVKVGSAEKIFPVIPLISIFYDKENFYNAEAAIKDTKPESGVRAIVVPHHLLASRLAADAFARASGTRYKTIVVVGPNHDDRGPDIVASAAISYETPNGLIFPDEEKVNEVRHLFASRSDYTSFLPEHSVGAMVPHLAEDFPGAKIVPIILSSTMNDEMSEKLATWLANLPLDTLVVFSVDFSHYKTQEQADAYDKETAAALTNRDVKKIEGWGNEHIDSPMTIATMLYYANKIGTSVNIIANKNANDFLPQKTDSTTSYFEIVVK
jgi:MEMO1 family protein